MLNLQNPEYWVEKLGLEKHPEGGYFKELYRSSESYQDLPKRFSGPRVFSTSIYFLLPSDSFSALHRIQSDELWHFHTGSALKITGISPSGELEEWKLGANLENGESFQVCVPHGYWFGAKVMEPNTFCLVGCTVAPGFDFADFEMGSRVELTKQFPQYQKQIEELTRS